MTLKRSVRDAIGHLFFWSGMARLSRHVLWRDRVAILLYHDPSPETLDRHLTYLRKICTIVSLDDVAKPSTGKPRAVITIDDGHAGNARLVPVFRKHGVRPTIYICSRIVGTTRQFWWLNDGARKEGVARLLRMPNAERLAHLRERGFSPTQEGAATALSSADIEAMRPWTDFQAHTRFHPVLPQCDPDECMNEIALSREEVGDIVQAQCLHFAYPNGRYGDREAEMVKQAGYRSARTCDVGWNDANTDPFRLKGIPVDDEASIPWLAAKLTCIPSVLLYMFGGRFDGRMPQV